MLINQLLLINQLINHALVDLSNLSDVVKSDIVKKDVHNAKIKDIEGKIPDNTNLATMLLLMLK